ncbi:AAA family ATPase [Actinomadura rugatobispora]|uniref:AAA family ATPase n=1 Tax=Actinomadura rugatobispora TaxID=1994 RepID=A0ABW0ZW75_9ACTN
MDDAPRHPAVRGAGTSAPPRPVAGTGLRLHLTRSTSQPTPLDLRAGGPEPWTAVTELRFPAGDLVAVSGLPGSGKSTLIQRTIQHGARVRWVDSQDAREDWERRLPLLPYGAYRPLVRAMHYVRLWRALRSGDSVLVHDSGAHAWIRRWLAREARLRGGALTLLLLDVPPDVALAGQASRGRRVSGRAFARHCRTTGRLIARTERGRPPRGCTMAVLLDRPAADALRAIGFGRSPREVEAGAASGLRGTSRPGRGRAGRPRLPGRRW